MANESQTATQEAQPTEATEQTTIDYSKWYFKYDPATYAFIPGAVHEKVDNSTDVEPSGLVDPVWSPSTNSWTGQSMDDYLAEQRANAKQQVETQQQALASLAMQVMKTNAELTARVKALESKETNNV